MLSILELLVEICMEIWHDLQNSTICGSAQTITEIGPHCG